jgi:hypothetical protein
VSAADDVRALRKTGKRAEALEMARAEYARNETDVWFLRAYAWALYDQVKKLTEDYEEKRIPAGAVTSRFSPLLHEFANFGNALRGDIAFSHMLRLSNKVSRDWVDFLRFARWAGIDDFSKEDRTPYVNDEGKQLDSLYTKHIRAICRETAARATDDQIPQKVIAWGQAVLDQALSVSPNDLWLNYYCSKLHLVRGEANEAVARLIAVMRRQSKAAWTWSLLGEILESVRPDDVLTCLIHATGLAQEEQEVATTRIRLAGKLAANQRFGEAATQAKKALQYREQNRFRVPQELAQLLASDWYRDAEANDTFSPLPDVKQHAKALLDTLDRRPLQFVLGVIDHVNTDKALSYVATGVDAGYGLKHKRFPDAAELAPGTIIEVGFVEADGSPIAWRRSGAATLPGLCETFSGTLARDEAKPFAFVRTTGQDVFVAPSLASTFAMGETHHVTCVAVKRRDNKQKIGWRVVSFV